MNYIEQLEQKQKEYKSDLINILEQIIKDNYLKIKQDKYFQQFGYWFAEEFTLIDIILDITENKIDYKIILDSHTLDKHKLSIQELNNWRFNVDELEQIIYELISRVKE